MKPRGISPVLVALIVCSASVFAVISAAEAVDFLETENHFLKPTDSVETPTVLISHDNKKYWVVPLLAGEDVATFFPVSYADKMLSVNEAVNSQLFSTAHFLRGYLTYRNKQAAQSKPWFVGLANQRIIGDLSNDLESEVFELNIIKAEVSASTTQTQIAQMQSLLNRMASTSLDLSEKIGLAVEAEAGFTNEPDSSHMHDISESFSSVFDGLVVLEADARTYQGFVSSLKSKLSTDSSLSTEKKSQFVAFADAPKALFTIGSTSIGDWVLIFQATSQQVDSLVLAANSKTFLDSAQAELQNRIKQNAAYSAIFGNDSDFSSKTGYPSLKLALDDLQSPENKPYWKNREQFNVAVEQFNSANRLLNAQEFELSLVAAQKAKLAAGIVKKDGFVSEEATGFDYAALVNVIIVLVLLLIVVFFLKNRDKIVGSVFQPQEAPVDKYGWQR